MNFTGAVLRLLRQHSLLPQPVPAIPAIITCHLPQKRDPEVLDWEAAQWALEELDLKLTAVFIFRLAIRVGVSVVPSNSNRLEATEEAAKVAEWYSGTGRKVSCHRRRLCAF